MTNKRAAGRYDFVPPDCDQERRAAILSDVSAMRVERLKLLLWLSERSEWEKTTPNFLDAAAIVQRRINKIEERLSEVGLACDGLERVL